MDDKTNHRCYRRIVSLVLTLSLCFSCFLPVFPTRAAVNSDPEQSTNGISPLQDPADIVGQDYFRFHLTDANGNLHKCETFSELQSSFTVAPESSTWNGAAPGEQRASNYPAVTGYVFQNLTYGDTVITELGHVDVSGTDYIYISGLGSDTGDPLTRFILPEGDKVTVNYTQEEFPIAYEVVVDGTTKSEDDSTFGLDSIFGIRRALTTSNRRFSVDVVIPAGYIDHVYIGSSSDMLQSDYSTFERFPVDTGYGNFPLGQDVEWEPTNTGAQVKKGSTKAPGYYSLSGTYSSGEAGSAVGDQICRLVLTKQPASSYTFSANEWLSSREVDRTPGEPNPRIWDHGVKREENADGSVKFTWSFETRKVWTEDFELRSLNINGFNVIIPFTNNGSTNWVTSTTDLPSGAKVTIRVELDYNNVRFYTVVIENARRNMVITGGSVNNSASGYSELIVSSLYGVDLQVKAVNAGESMQPENVDWWNVGEGQSMRTGTISWGSTTNVYNFDYSLTASEYGGKYNGNIRFRLKDGFGWPSGNIYGTDSSGKKCVRFEEKTGSKSQNFSVGNGTISGPDPDGWYYTKLDSVGTIGLLTIHAVPIQYQVRYLDGVSNHNELNPSLNDGSLGTTSVDNMPTFLSSSGGIETTENNTDTNRGSYYSLASAGSYGNLGSDKITVSGDVPTAVVRQRGYVRNARFEGWVLADPTGNAYRWDEDKKTFVRDQDGHLETTKDPTQFLIIAPSSTVDLSTVSAAGTVYDASRQNYLLYLTAYWTTPPAQFTYFVTFNYKDPSGAEVPYAQSGEDGSTPDDDVYMKGSGDQAAVSRSDNFFDPGTDGASVVFDSKHKAAISWLKSHPWYKYDQNKNGDGSFLWTGIQDNGEVDVWFISSLGQLTVTKKVNGLDDEFEFEVTFSLPENDPDTDGDESDYFKDDGIYSVPFVQNDGTESDRLELTKADNNYKGKFKLGGNQSITFDVPAGTEYTVKETPMTGYETSVTCEYGKEMSDGTGKGWMGTVSEAATKGPEVVFNNTGTGVTIEMILHHLNCDPTKKCARAAGGDEVMYTILVKNTSDTTIAGPVTISDSIPAEGGKYLSVDESSISGGGVWDASAHTITWTLNGLGVEKREFEFKAILPVVEEETTFTNSATIVYEADHSQTSNDVDVEVHPFWLRVTKVVEGGGGDPLRKFDFQVFLTAPDGYELDTEYPFVYENGGDMEPHVIDVEHGSTPDTGSIQLSLSNGEAFMIYGLAEGTKYEVEELGYDDYSVTYTQEEKGKEVKVEGNPTGEISNDRDVIKVKNFKGAPDLSLTYTVNGVESTSVEIDDIVEYSITIENNGDANAGPTKVTATVPDGLILDENTIIDGGELEDGIITWTIDSIDIKTSRTVTFCMKVPNITKSTKWTSLATIVDVKKSKDPVPTTVLFTAVPDLSVTKTVTSVEPEVGYTVGNTITWNVEVKNTGNVYFTCPVSVIDELTNTKEFIALDGLPVGESASMEVSYTVTNVDCDAGSIINSVSVSAKPVADPFEAVSDPVFVVPPRTPSEWYPSDWGSTGDSSQNDPSKDKPAQEETKRHTAFMQGYPGDLFGPDDNMTRAQAAQMFYNLLTDREVAQVVRFTDVPDTAWYAEAVNTLAGKGLVLGVGNGTYEPDREITRAEFVAIACRFFGEMREGENIFPDVRPNDWFYQYVVSAVACGWIDGYPDGTFKPLDIISRSEAAKLTNRLLDCVPDSGYIKDHSQDIRRFLDVDTGYWAYEEIVAATNSHDYMVADGKESWTGIRTK